MKVIISLFIFSVPFFAYADLVQINHHPAAMRLTRGKAYDASRERNVYSEEWKVTNAIPNSSSWASGFVVAVKDGLKFSDVETKKSLEINDRLPWFYPNGTTFKAVYILTNHHVWYNDRAELQATASQLNPDPRFYDVMIATELQIYDNSVREIFRNTYFTQTTPINRWHDIKYQFNITNMGLREIVTCYEPRKNLNRIDRFNYYWGCDFTLIRVIVHSSVNVSPQRISDQKAWSGNPLTIWFTPFNVGNYKISYFFGNNDETFVADIDRRSAVAQPGWSGSPVMDRSSNNVIGMLASAWPDHSSMAGGYSIDYVMKTLKVAENVELDFNFLKTEPFWGGPYKGNFYGHNESRLSPPR